MQDLLSIGTNRRESMIGTGIGLGLAGYRLRTSFEAMPSLDLQFADRRMIQAVLGPTPSFSRASTGTYFDSQGVLKSAAVNGPRFNHTFNGTSWVSKGLLVEEQRTNSSPYSVTFNSGNTPWALAGLTLSLNSANAPDGTNTATKIIEGGGAGNIYRSLTFSGTVTWSVFAKPAGRNYVQIFIGNLNSPEAGINVDLTNGAITNQSPSVVASGTQYAGNGWYRIWFSATGSGGVYYPAIGTSNSAQGIRASYTGDGVSGVYIWGAQWESGSFPTSYIANSGSCCTTRSADVCQITGSDFSGLWNGTEGTVVGDFDRLFVPTGTASALYTARDSSNNNAIYYYIDVSNDVSQVYASGASATFDFGSPVGAGISNKIATAYKANDFAASRNSSTPLTDTSGAVPSGQTLMEIGSTVSANYLNGHIARLRYYPTRLTNAKLQELST